MANHLHYLEEQYISENYPKFGVPAVASKLNRSNSTITRYVKKMNLHRDKASKDNKEQIPDFKYDLDFSHVFNEKITKELAYWLGFFWADGTVSEDGSIVIEIIREDGEQLKPLFDSIFPFSINYRERQGRRPQMSFRACNKKVKELLNSLGKYPKSFESHEKIFSYLNNDELRIYFLRGLIDGDGNFYINSSKYYAQFTIASNFNQDWSFLLDYLKEFHPHICQSDKKSGKSSVLRVTGEANLLKLIDFLHYKNTSIGLQRKANKALEIVELYNSKPIKTKNRVGKYSLEGKLLKIYDSVKEAATELGLSESAIRNCLCRISSSSAGFQWKYINGNINKNE